MPACCAIDEAHLQRGVKGVQRRRRRGRVGAEGYREVQSGGRGAQRGGGRGGAAEGARCDLALQSRGGLDQRLGAGEVAEAVACHGVRLGEAW